MSDMEKDEESLDELEHGGHSSESNTSGWPSNPGGLPDYILERGAWREFDENGNRKN